MKTLFSSASILAVLAMSQLAVATPSSACPDDGKKPKLAAHDAAGSACPDKTPKPPSVIA